MEEILLEGPRSKTTHRLSEGEPFGLPEIELPRQRFSSTIVRSFGLALLGPTSRSAYLGERGGWRPVGSRPRRGVASRAPHTGGRARLVSHIRFALGRS